MRAWIFLVFGLFGAAVGCSTHTPTTSNDPATSASPPLVPWAGFIDVPPRQVTLHGRSIAIDATAKLFANFWPADEEPENKPIFILFNGFAADVVRAFGTGPITVDDKGDVAINSASFTQMANLLYVDPRQSGFSYDVLSSRAPAAGDCSADVFNEYVDAGDVLLAVMTFLDSHTSLAGPLVWIGESYAGVRIQWMLTFARGNWNLAPYQDPSLENRLSAFARRSDLARKQILLEPWLLGKAHADAIAAECFDPALLAAVSKSLTSPSMCADSSACDCATAADLSFYDYAWTNEHENQRLVEADQAQVAPDQAEKILGVPLSSIAGLAAGDRQKGFKCGSADASTPNQDALDQTLGVLPSGQVYFLPFTPLTPGYGSENPDWQSSNSVGSAFVDNLKDVATFVTDGPLDLVVPERALAPALRSISGVSTVNETANAIDVSTPSGSRTIAIFHYPNAGHMITLAAPSALASDIRGWL